MQLKQRWSLFIFLGVLLVCGLHQIAIATDIPDPPSVTTAQIKSVTKTIPNPRLIQPGQDLTSGESFSRSPSLPQSQPRISIHYDFYPVQGASADELNRQMLLNAPFRHTSGVSDFAAITKWIVKWSFTPKNNGKQCILTNPVVRADIRIVLPSLQQPHPRRLAIRNEWFRYLQALKTHEDGHKANGIAAAKDIQRWLELLGPARSCAILVKNVEIVTQKMIAQYRRNDQAYDRITDHGLTQGAVLNSQAIKLGKRNR